MKGLFWKTLKKEQVRLLWFICLLVYRLLLPNPVVCVCVESRFGCAKEQVRFIVPPCDV